jgi:hypothetical protein
MVEKVKFKSFLIQNPETQESWTISEYAEKLDLPHGFLKKKLYAAFRDENRPDIRVDVSHPVLKERKGTTTPKGILYLLKGNVLVYSFTPPKEYVIAINLKAKKYWEPGKPVACIEWDKGVFPKKKEK